MRRVLAALLSVVGACGGAPASPSRTVEIYLDALARDPIRSLVLVTDDFQRRHAMRFDAVGEGPPVSLHFEGSDAPAWGDAASEAAADPSLDLERARLGWLTALTRRVYAQHVPEIALEVDDEEVTGDRARVALRAHHRSQTASLRVTLVRATAASPWRIDAIEIPNEGTLPPVLPYLVAPTAARHRRIERILAR